MHITRSLARLILGVVVLSASCAVFAQGPPDHDRDNPGHGGMPPGQAKKHGYDNGMPPGQAKKFRFRDEDRNHFYTHYHEDADHWRGHHRPVFVPGQYVPQSYYVRPVPRSYWVGVVAPPPPGYSYGYYQGYVVAYNPTTRIVADVIDIIGAATH
jgi:hypothetical protein